MSHEYDSCNRRYNCFVEENYDVGMSYKKSKSIAMRSLLTRCVIENSVIVTKEYKSYNIIRV